MKIIKDKKRIPEDIPEGFMMPLVSESVIDQNGDHVFLDNFNYTRSSEDWVFNENGILEKVGANIWQPDQFTGGLFSPRRMFPAFEATTNSLLDNRDMTTGNWNINSPPTVNRDAVGMDGQANTACTLTDDDGTGPERIQQDITVADNSDTHTAVWYVKKDSDTSRFPLLLVRLDGGTRVTNSIRFNTSTGAYNVRDGSDNWTITELNEYWKVETPITNNGTGNTTLSYRVYPAWTSDITADTYTTGSCVVDFAGVFLNQSYAGPPIETGSSTATRDADNATWNNIDTSEDFKQGEGTIVADYDFPKNRSSQRVAFELYSDASNFIRLSLGSSSDTFDHRFVVQETGTNVAVIDQPASLNDGDSVKVAVMWDTDDFEIVVNGTSHATDTSGAVPSITDLVIGNRRQGDVAFNSYMRSMFTFTNRIASSKAQSITS